MPIGLLIAIATFSIVILLLWNWLMPTIFGVSVINFWQALGLLILTRILFGSLGFAKKMGTMHEMHHHVKESPLHKKWMGMSHEQRREFVERRRKFGFGHPHPFDTEEYDEPHGAEDKCPDGQW